jgi:hypothetical protein
MEDFNYTADSAVDEFSPSTSEGPGTTDVNEALYVEEVVDCAIVVVSRQNA